MNPAEANAASRPTVAVRSNGRSDSWRDWKWQQRHAIKTVEALSDEIDDLPVEAVRENAKNRKIQITLLHGPD